jgi:hypothetical protein
MQSLKNSCTKKFFRYHTQETSTQKAVFMNTWKRVTIGILCYIFAICLFLLDLDNDALYIGALFSIAGTLALREELVKTCRAFFVSASKRANKVAKERRCALCAAPPLFMLHLVPIDHTVSSPFAGCELHVCKEHHPNKEIAEKADELHHFIKQMDRNLTYDRVYPYIFYET